MIGKTFSHYRVTGKLGEGGMGEVYLAEDSSLDRKVALKFLPESMQQDEAAEKRFLREAKSAASLDHPFICKIYEAGVENGRPFISMEYVQGATLKDRLAEGPLPIKDALQKAVELAEALEAAQKQGMVHRDLKPANIMFTPEGHVKVMDFGLAKQLGSAEPSESQEQTITSLTTPGAALGTPAYMSPEQLRTGEADTRSDIFSFGIVLYEMLTGLHPFKKPVAIETSHAILNETPVSPSEHLRQPLPLLDHILRKMLAKKPDERYQLLHDVGTDLQEVLQNTLPTGSMAPVQTGKRGIILLLSLAAAAVVGIAAAVYWLSLPSTPQRPSVAAVESVPLTTYPGMERHPTFSPDSSQVAFSWNGADQNNTDIYIKVLGSEEPRRLTLDPAVDDNPAWSPDGRQIAFLRVTAPGKSEVRLISPNGGPERVLASAVTATYPGLAWSPDGRILAVPDQPSADEAAGIFLLDAETGKKQRLTSTPPGSAKSDWMPAFSPDGQTVAFLRQIGTYTVHVFLVPATGGEPRQLLTTASSNEVVAGLAWTSSGEEIIFTAPRSFPDVSTGSSIFLWRISTTDGHAERLPDTEGAREVIVSRKGDRLAYSKVSNDLDIWRIDLHEKDKPQTKFITSTQMDANPQFSPDGRQIVFTSQRSVVNEIWRADSEASNLLRLTSLGSVGSPRWSPDGKAVAFDYAPKETSDVYVVGASGGPAQRITRDPARAVRPSWSRDGAWIYFGSNRSGEWQVWKVPAAGEEKGQARQITRGGGYAAIESIDGKHAYFSRRRSTEEEPQNAIWRVPVEGGEEQPIIESLDSSDTNWDVTAEGIYFVDRASSTEAPWTVYLLSFQNGKVTRLSQLEYPPFRSGPAFCVSPDGRWILSAQWQSGSDLMLVEDFR